MSATVRLTCNGDERCLATYVNLAESVEHAREMATVKGWICGPDFDVCPEHRVILR